MDKNYTIEIPNYRLKTYNLVTFIILTLNFIGFGFVYVVGSSYIAFLALVGIIINAVPWVNYIINKSHFQNIYAYVGMVISAVLWVYFGNVIMGLLLILFALLSYVINKKQFVVFNETGIKYPTLPTKKIAWCNVNFVILKDDILTIDFNKNSIIQVHINATVNPSLLPFKFNEFCNKMIAQAL